MDILTLPAGTVRRKNILLTGVLNEKIKRRKLLTSRNFQSRREMVEEPMVEAIPQVVMTLITTTEINGVLQRMGMV